MLLYFLPLLLMPIYTSTSSNNASSLGLQDIVTAYLDQPVKRIKTRVTKEYVRDL